MLYLRAHQTQSNWYLSRMTAARARNGYAEPQLPGEPKGSTQRLGSTNNVIPAWDSHRELMSVTGSRYSVRLSLRTSGSLLLTCPLCLSSSKTLHSTAVPAGVVTHGNSFNPDGTRTQKNYIIPAWNSPRAPAAKAGCAPGTEARSEAAPPGSSRRASTPTSTARPLAGTNSPEYPWVELRASNGSNHKRGGFGVRSLRVGGSKRVQEVAVSQARAARRVAVAAGHASTSGARGKPLGVRGQPTLRPSLSVARIRRAGGGGAPRPRLAAKSALPAQRANGTVGGTAASRASRKLRRPASAGLLRRAPEPAASSKHRRSVTLATGVTSGDNTSPVEARVHAADSSASVVPALLPSAWDVESSRSPSPQALELVAKPTIDISRGEPSSQTMSPQQSPARSVARSAPNRKRHVSSPTTFTGGAAASPGSPPPVHVDGVVASPVLSQLGKVPSAAHALGDGSASTFGGGPRSPGPLDEGVVNSIHAARARHAQLLDARGVHADATTRALPRAVNTRQRKTGTVPARRRPQSAQPRAGHSQRMPGRT